MTRSCVVPSCKERRAKVVDENKTVSASETEEPITFHLFPWADPLRLKLWTLAIPRRKPDGSGWTPNKNSIICSKHFNKDAFHEGTQKHRWLKSTAVPCIFPHTTEDERLRKDSDDESGGEEEPQDLQNPDQTTEQTADQTVEELVDQNVEPTTESPEETSILEAVLTGVDENQAVSLDPTLPTTLTKWCTVSGCFNNREIETEIKFFRFPKDADRRKDWLTKCGREDLISKSAAEICNTCLICDIHFMRSQFETVSHDCLLPTAVPTIFISKDDVDPADQGDISEHRRIKLRTEKFLDLVKQMPQLWQKTHREYVGENKELRDKLYTHLASATGLSLLNCVRKLEQIRNKVRLELALLPPNKDGVPDLTCASSKVTWDHFFTAVFMEEDYLGGQCVPVVTRKYMSERQLTQKRSNARSNARVKSGRENDKLTVKISNAKRKRKSSGKRVTKEEYMESRDYLNSSSKEELSKLRDCVVKCPRLEIDTLFVGGVEVVDDNSSYRKSKRVPRKNTWFDDESFQLEGKITQSQTTNNEDDLSKFASQVVKRLSKIKNRQRLAKTKKMLLNVLDMAIKKP